MSFRTLVFVSLLAALFVVGSACCQSVPDSITYQGELTDLLGQPLSSPQDLTFKLYEAASGGGAAFWTESINAVQLDGGIFTVQLGPLTVTDLSKPQVWMEVTVGTNQPLPRTRIVSAS